MSESVVVAGVGDIVEHSTTSYSYNLTEFENAILQQLREGKMIEFQELIEKEHPAPFDIYRKTLTPDLQKESHLQETLIIIPPVKPDDLPSPHSPSPYGVSMTACEVCGVMLAFTATSSQRAVRCKSCNEVTPIKSAPPGMKYVRCPCRCLLLCKSTDQKIFCTRTDCKRTLNLAPHPSVSLDAPPPSITLDSALPGMWRVSCACCNNVFFYTLKFAVVRCPYCQKVSSIRPKYGRNHGIMCLISALLMLPFIGIVAGERKCPEYWPFIFFPLMFIILALMITKAVQFFAMKVSKIESPA